MRYIVICTYIRMCVCYITGDIDFWLGFGFDGFDT